MQKIFNTILLIIFLVLVALFAYKTIRTPQEVKVAVPKETIQEQNKNNPEETTKTQTNNVDNEPNAKADGENQKSTDSGVKIDQTIDQKIHDYIINHPEVLIESIEGMQRKKLEESDKKTTDYLLENKSSIENDGAPPVIGNKDGDVSVVVFYDYNCSYCKQANKFNNEVISKDPNVKFVLRPLPILGGTSMYAAKVALAVHKINEADFLVIHNEMMDMKQINEDSVKNLLLKYKIDYSIVENELNSFSIKQLISKNFEFAKNLGIKGAPSYVINGIFIPGLIDTDKFMSIINEIRKISEQTQNQQEQMHNIPKEKDLENDETNNEEQPNVSK